MPKKDLAKSRRQEARTEPADMISSAIKAAVKISRDLQVIVPAYFAAASVLQAAEASTLDQRIFKVVTASSPGTAFVIGPSDRGQCILITAYHVIKGNSNSEPLEILTPKGQKFSINKTAFKYNETKFRACRA